MGTEPTLLDEDFGPEDEDLLDEALRAAIEGPFFDDDEFATLMGFTRDDLRDVAASWRQRPRDDTTDLMVNNVLVNLIGYPHSRWDAWATFSQAEPARLSDLLAKWKRDSRRGDEGAR